MTNPMLAELCESVAQSLDNGQKAVAVLSTMLKTVGLVQGYAVADEILGDLKYAAQALPAITRRTHHATLADMAKRLEAAERDAGKCWALHFKGPDDVVAAPSREAAEIAAHNFNAFWDAHKHLRAHDVRVVAEVVEWEHGAVEHAKSAAEHWPEYADLLNAAIDATQEGAG